MKYRDIRYYPSQGDTMKIKTRMTPVELVFFFVASALMLQGCAGSTFSSKADDSVTPAKTETTAVYYEFEDVLVPKELAIEQDSTVVVSTPGYTSGILMLKGRVKGSSLFHFFNNNMLKDNWNMITQIKSPGSIIMIFEKKSRWAVITIREKTIYTYVEIGVAPTIGNRPASSASNLFD